MEIRKRAQALLKASYEEGFNDSKIAVAMLSEEQREPILSHKGTKRGGKRCVGTRRLQQDAPRPNADWRKGTRTPSADNAFKLGEALQRLQTSNSYGGLYVAYTLGYASEVGQALLRFSKQNNDVLYPLALYVSLPLIHSIGNSTLVDKLHPSTRKEILEEEEKHKHLFSLASRIPYTEAWEKREPLRKENADFLFFEYLGARARMQNEIDESIRITWQSLIDYPLSWAASIATKINMNLNEILLGIVSLSFGNIATGGTIYAQESLVEALIACLESSQQAKPHKQIDVLTSILDTSEEQENSL